MHDIKLVYVVYPIYYLLKELASLHFFYSSLCNDIIKKLAIRHEFCYQEEVLIIFQDFIQLCDVWVSEYLKDLYLSRNTLSVRFLKNSTLLKNLHSYLLF